MTRRFDPRDLLDRQLGRVTMYRLVTIVLGLLALVMLVFTAAGTFTDPFTVEAELLTLAVLVVAAVVSSRLIGLALARCRAHTESSVITGLLLFFMFWPVDAGRRPRLAGGCRRAGQCVEVRPRLARAPRVQPGSGGRPPGRHRAAVGRSGRPDQPDVVGRAPRSCSRSSWSARCWCCGAPGGSTSVCCSLWWPMCLCVWGLVQGFGAPVGARPWRRSLYSFPIVFMAGFMVSEPLTLPPRRVQQLVVAVVIAVCFACGPVLSHPRPDGAAHRRRVAWGRRRSRCWSATWWRSRFARRRGVTLELERRPPADARDPRADLPARPPVAFTPGQYVELTRAALRHGRARCAAGVQHQLAARSRTDWCRWRCGSRRGRRASSRRCSPSSRDRPCTAPASVATSSGPPIRASRCCWWPAASASPRSSASCGTSPAATWCWSTAPPRPPRSRSPTSSPVCGSCWCARSGPSHLPAQLDVRRRRPSCPGELIADAVPDLGQRRAYVSGPPAMVNAVRTDLKRRCVSVTTDYFSGY